MLRIRIISGSRIRIRIKVRSRELWRLPMEPRRLSLKPWRLTLKLWRLTLEPWRVCKPVKFAGLRIRIHCIRIQGFNDQKLKKNTAEKKLICFWIKLQKKPSALKRGHPALQNMNFKKKFILLWVIFALLDPDPDSESGSGSTDPIESGSNPDPDPQSWIRIRTSD